jgi:Tfp pilus assembly protein PilX
MRRTKVNIRPAQRGFVVVAVVVALALAMTLFGVWARAAVRQQHWLEGQALRIEATRLAEAGLARAEFRRANDPEYADETWTIPAADFHSRHAAEVRIRVETVGNTLRYTATADYPVVAVRRARVTKQIEALIPATSTEP